MTRPQLYTGTCTKCGGLSAGLTYRAIRTFGGAVTDEWIDLECRTCGYIWEEAVKS